MNARVTREGPVDDNDVVTLGIVMGAATIGGLIGLASTALFIVSFFASDLEPKRALLAITAVLCLSVTVTGVTITKDTQHGQTAIDSLIGTLADGLIVAVIVAVIAGVVTLLLGLINRFTPTPGVINATFAGIYLLALAYVIAGIVCVMVAERSDARDERG